MVKIFVRVSSKLLTKLSCSGNEEETDTISVFNGLSSAADVPKFLSGIEGPFAFVYYRPETESLWFGRDYFGRHSLLVSKGRNRDS